MRIELLLLALSTTACTDKDVAGGVDTDPGPPAAADACGGWTGIQALGTRWDYNYDGAAGVGVFGSEVTAFDVGGAGALTISSASDVTSVAADTVSTTIGEHLCDSDGFWLTGIYLEYIAVAGGVEYTGWSRITYDAPALLNPLTIAVGDGWSSVQTGTLENANGPTAIDNVVEYAVVDQVEVTVPAGTYDALVVESTIDGEPGPTTWVVEGLGTVQGDDTELVGYTP